MPYERRQGNIVAVVALIVTLLTNIIALTWGASKIAFSIENLNQTTKILSASVEAIQEFNQRLDIRMTVAEKTLEDYKK